MYELDYVKKRKRRKWIAIGAGISVIVIATLSIVAFLGRFVGTFTVKLETGNVKLTLSETQEFAQETSYLRISELPTLQEYTYSALETIGHDVIDNENSTYMTSPAANLDRDGNVRSLNYFKYTFFVKNVGNIPASYDMQVRILDSASGDNASNIEDTIRVMVYHNGDLSKHEKDVYALRSRKSHVGDDGNVSFDEKISIDPYGYAKQFQSSEVIATIPEEIGIGDVKRYTVVFWLEGYDPESNRFAEVPLNARLKLGVEINAYEN